nr:xanthine dehydrogenase accessory protein XdhC [Amylibacter sp.]
MGLNLRELADAVARHGRVVRVLIADHQGSTPRESGTSMLVWNGGQSGTIGGGALELQAVETAVQIDKSIALKVPLGPALGQCCGGAVTLVLEPFTASNLPNEGENYSRRITGDKDKPLALRRLLKSQRNSGATPALIWQQGWLMEPLEAPKQPLWLYGAGHVGRAIVDTLQDLPFDITWVDTAPDRFPETIPAHANPLVAQTPADAVKHAPADAHHLVLTYSHTLDLDLCHAILSHPHKSLGLIGSKTKRRRFTSKLTALGHGSAQIAGIICPIGQRDLGKTPKAIAIGVASELLTINAVNSAQHKATA